MKLTRFVKNLNVTIGALELDDGHTYFTVERPWRNNKVNISCIPDGEYTVKRVDSPKFGPGMWEVVDVSDRTHIILHVANFPNDVEGCIGLGMGMLNNLRGVSESRNAIKSFYAATKDLETFELTVTTAALA